MEVVEPASSSSQVGLFVGMIESSKQPPRRRVLLILLPLILTATGPPPTPHPHMQPPAPTNGMAEDGALPPSARSAAPGSPLRLYVAHFLVLEEEKGEEGEGAGAAAGAGPMTRRVLHQYLYEHPNGLFIVGLGT